MGHALFAEVDGVRIALVSEHASPLATLGGVDAGGQNVHVAALAAGLATLGNAVTVYTRRDDPRLPRARHDGAPASSSSTSMPGRRARSPKTRSTRTSRRSRRRLRSRVGGAPAGHRARALLDERPRGARRGQAARDPGRAHVSRAGRREAQASGQRRHLARGARWPKSARIVREADRIDRDGERGDLRCCCAWARTRARCSVVPCGVDLERFTPDGPARTPPRRPHAHRHALAPRAAQGRSPTVDRGARRTCRAPSSSIAGGGEGADLAGGSGSAATLRARARARRRGPRVPARARRPQRTCPRCCGRPTSSRARRGTSRSASSRSKRWRAASPSSSRRSAGSSTRSWTA